MGLRQLDFINRQCAELSTNVELSQVNVMLERTSNAAMGLGDRIQFKSKAVLNIICTHALQSPQRYVNILFHHRHV